MRGNAAFEYVKAIIADDLDRQAFVAVAVNAPVSAETLA